LDPFPFGRARVPHLLWGLLPVFTWTLDGVFFRNPLSVGFRPPLGVLWTLLLAPWVGTGALRTTFWLGGFFRPASTLCFHRGHHGFSFHTTGVWSRPVFPLTGGGYSRAGHTLGVPGVELFILGSFFGGTARIPCGLGPCLAGSETALPAVTREGLRGLPPAFKILLFLSLSPLSRF